MDQWSVAARLTVTLFVCLIGTGYLSALANMYFQHSGADGREGLTLDDLRAAFHGLAVEPPPRTDTHANHGHDQQANVPSSADNTTAMSRMAEMTQPGGKMRKHLAEGGVPAIRTLETWLAHGAPESEFEKQGLARPGDPAPIDVLNDQCLECHNAESGKRSEDPFGPDLFTIEYEMVYRYAAPGTAKGTDFRETPDPAPQATKANTPTTATPEHSTTPPPPAKPKTRTLGPASLSHLFLVTHIHMLSIPVFTLIISGLFLMDAGPWRRRLAPVPMMTLVVDFSCWWLARQSESFIYVMVAAGALYGAAMGIQIVTVLVSLWRFDRTAT